MKLVIFDLDQTLVDFIPVHDAVTRELFQRFFGVDARLSEIDFAGRSVTENFAELARLKKVPEGRFRKNLNQLLKNYEKVFSDSMPKDAVKFILPGVIRLLTELARTDNVVVLYTGDSPGIVAVVFHATNLGQYFRFAVYGTETPTRADMVILAIEKAERLTGKKFQNKDIVIIGDSIRDIDCGKQFNAATIAVATGFHSTERLLAGKPDYLFKDLTDYNRVLKAIEASEGSIPPG